jgi:hypothetical protein
MSRMAKDRGDGRTGSSHERHKISSQRDGSSPPSSGPVEGDFERAFADALRDILLHEQGRHAAA